MVNWQINVYSATGTSKATYNNASPGGIVSSITWDVEPSGNCLTGAFEGIPSELNIAPRDLVKISIGGVDKFFGYVKNGPNPYSKEVFTYNLEGAKKLIFETLIGSFWFNPTTGLVSGLIPHDDIITALESYFPSFVTGFTNQASTTSGNKGPIIAADFSLGEVIDSIVNSAQDDWYEWGISASGGFFVKPRGSSSIDFTAVESKRVELTDENADDICTAVRFVFSVPEGYYHPSLNQRLEIWYGDFASADNIFLSGDFAPISFDYEDATAITQYGKVTKVIPLVLTESWLKLLPVNYLSTNFANVNLLSGSSFFDSMETNTGSTTLANKLTAISTEGTSTYIRNPSIVSTAIAATLYEIGTTILPSAADDLIGIHMRVGLTGTDRPIRFQGLLNYEHVTTPDADEIVYTRNDYTPNTDDNWSYPDTILRWLFYRPALQFWKSDPNEVVSGNPRDSLELLGGSISPLQSLDGNSYTNIPAQGFKIYEWFYLALNRDALEAFAETIIKTPSGYPSQIRVQEDLGLAYDAVVATTGGNVTVDIARISYSLSVDTGFTVTYATGIDDQRSNEFLTRLMARDANARNAAFSISTARV